MHQAIVLDVVLVVVLIAYLLYGLRNGLSQSLFVIAGIVAGVIAAFFLAPLAASLVPIPVLRLVVTIIVAVGLVTVGHGVGVAIGGRLRRGVARSPLSGIDRLLGAALTTIAAALVASMLAFTVAQLGVPVISQAVSGSTVLRAISALTPTPVQAWLAQVRGTVAARGIPIIVGALDPAMQPIPPVDAGSPALTAAAQSVVRITGNAYACGQSQSGSGFVVAAGRVVTNAHVVAGVSQPVVEAPNGETIGGQIVYFDPENDLAVIDVPGLSAPPLTLTATLPAGATAAIEGYPFGGPFSVGGAAIDSVGTARVEDIYGTTETDREIYTLAAQVREGNSGGPVLTSSGAVAGIVFATSADSATVGYAMTMAELKPVAAEAGGLSTPVSSGDCIKG
jgi:S1-C subfamily serine protease